MFLFERAMGDRGTTRLCRGVGLAARARRGTVPAVRALVVAGAHLNGMRALRVDWLKVSFVKVR